MKNTLRSLGPFESKVVLTFREQGRTVVKVADVCEILRSETTTDKVIRNLLRKGWLSRIIGGKYMFLPPEHGPENLGENNSLAMAAAVVEPSYIGWWSAASWHGLTTQKPMTVFVAVTRQSPAREIEGSYVRFVTITRRKFFGYQKYDVYGRCTLISTPVKTLIDCVDRPDLAGGPSELTRIAHTALLKIPSEEVLKNAMPFKSKALLQRLGFISDLVDKPMPQPLRQSLRDNIPVAYRSYFGRKERRDGDIGYVAAWGLHVNARRTELLADVPFSSEDR